ASLTLAVAVASGRWINCCAYRYNNDVVAKVGGSERELASITTGALNPLKPNLGESLPVRAVERTW
ncbi:MAG: hypothetical protein M3157_03560, partial [Actinomycetota bacterium]|nr:hypothetical protein [Actinomycetota bacterium]